MVNVIINNKKVKVKEDTIILNLAKKLGIDIPTLCYHPDLSPYGACRLCTVEIIRDTHKRFVTACNYPIREEIEIRTNSEDVIRIRKMLIELLLARCKKIPILEELAKEYDVKEVRFKQEEEDCILCGLCVRVCEEIVTTSAINFSMRGITRKVTTPFEVQSDVCIGCGACAYICPAGRIKIEDKNGIRYIWNTEHKLVKCKKCNRYFTTEKQIEFIKNKTKIKEELLYTCPDCR